MTLIYECGVNTADLIRKTKLKFEKLQDLGIDKRNDKIFFLISNFNQYVLNNHDLAIDYLIKMKQIGAMNKTIYENYRDIMNTEADKSGFLIVKGTFVDFGKILFVNRKACSILGYEQNEVISKTINMLMPNLISEKHASFLNIYRETGEPVFISKIQNLFMKNKNGHIIPVKVYVQFYYDKTHGHVFCAVINKVKQLFPFKNKK